MSTYKIYTDQYGFDTYLAHHGIKGMHWGVRRFETATGHLTDAGKRRYAKFDGDYQKKQKEKTNNRSENLHNIKDKITSPEAKRVYKNVAKGAAIAGALLATGVTMHAIKDNADFKNDMLRAKELTDEIMNDNFKKLSPEKRKVISDAIRDANIQNIQNDRRNASRAKKQLIKDTAQAYINRYNPKKRDPSLLDTVRLRRVQGGYAGPDTTINSSNISKYKKGLKRHAQAVIEPEKFEAKRKKQQEKARKKYGVAI